jgi:glucose/arabinose dehydrogenase
MGISQVFNQVTLQAPVAMMQAPGDSSRWFVVEQRGTVRIIPANTGTIITDNDISTFIDISGRVTNGGETGLLGMAIHPDFATNGEVFLSYTRGGPLTSYVSRFRSFDGGLTLDSSSEEIIMTILQDFSNHNGGHIAFGPDGFLYAGWGDGGSAGDPNNRAQDTSNLLGTFTRIDVDGGSPYSIPDGNPYFASAANPCTQGFGASECPEIFAWGLRNPWRWSFDRQTGEIWVGDVGQDDWEEIDKVENGQNYGWSVYEGTNCYPPGSACSFFGLAIPIDPITEYSHAQGNSVTGGYVYRGSGFATLQGMYIYGDFSTGVIWTIPAASQQGAIGEILVDTTLNISSFAEGNDGEILIIHYDGEIYQFALSP